MYPLLPVARAFRDAGHEVALATAPSWKERARRCTAVVSHAGSGSTLGALADGLPMLLVPQGADQFDNAAACEAAGAAIVIAGPSVEAGAVAAAVDALLAEPSYAEAARRIAAELALMGSPEEVVALLARRSACT